MDLNRMEVFRVDDRTPLSPDDGEYLGSSVSARARISGRSRIEQAERPELRAGRPRASLAEKWRLRLGSHAPGGARAPRRALRPRRAGAAGAGTGRRIPKLAVPHGPSEPRALPPVRPRSRRAAVRRPGQHPRARVRLPRRDPLPRRGRQPTAAASRSCFATRCPASTEEDQGILGKARCDVRAGHTEVRRRRRLVVSWVATTGNYEYGFFWYLHQDGTIESEAKLTGILTDGGARAGRSGRVRGARRSSARTG